VNNNEDEEWSLYCRGNPVPLTCEEIFVLDLLGT